MMSPFFTECLFGRRVQHISLAHFDCTIAHAGTVLLLTIVRLLTIALLLTIVRLLTIALLLTIVRLLSGYKLLL